MKTALQWGGRFSAAPDPELLRFGSSLEDDLVLAPFDAACSQAHVTALMQGGIIPQERADQLQAALHSVEREIAGGSFASYARESGAEDVHGAIDARVRELVPSAGEWLHAGRSRNDQVATTLLLYCADRSARGCRLAGRIVSHLLDRAEGELSAGTLLAGTTHWQPAQPVLLAFWLAAAAEAFFRDAERFSNVRHQALELCPLGSGALAGSSLPLDRNAAAEYLGFRQPARNAMDAVGNRDRAFDAAHACVRAVMDASRISEEIVIWCTPAFGYAELADEASTGSSLMPQKRNPDPFELVRATSGDLIGRYCGALASASGIALSYHRDLQIAKRAAIGIVETALSALAAFAAALERVRFRGEKMGALAGEGYTAATDVADSLILGGTSARAAHAQVGDAIRAFERDAKPLDWPDAKASVAGKKTSGSTNPRAVEESIAQLRAQLESIRA